jgi:hypothetical protein
MQIQKCVRGGLVLVAFGLAACSSEDGGASSEMNAAKAGTADPTVAGDAKAVSPDAVDSPSDGHGAAVSEGELAPESEGPSMGAPAAPPAAVGTTSPATAPLADESSGVIEGDTIAVPTEPSEPDPSEPEVDPQPTQAGQLTAGVWDDNRNFERFMGFRKPMYADQLSGLLGFSDTDHEDANELFKDLPGKKQALDIALVIDTTGSMGDEIQYLQTEVTSISMRIEKVYPDAEQHWALVVYKDVGDEYVAQTYDFGADADDFRGNLAEQFASGGGDFPEAPDAAISAMNELSWRDDDATARLAFWVADAPYHNDRAQDMTDAVTGAQKLGVHIYPVASSGVDEFTELAMRSTAQLTGGRYLFLTDDSGIGGEHKEPSIPCYFVTRLDVAMLRMVDIEMTGEYKEPAEDEIIRSGGDPQDGACELSSGEAVFAF